MAKTKFSDTIPADRFEFQRLYGNEKYSLQNMVLGDTGFPDQVAYGRCTSVYHDRVYTEWRASMEGITSTQSADAFWSGVSSEDLLKFGTLMAKVIGFRHKVTSVRVVRFTNVATGYPCYRLDIANGGKIVHKHQRLVEEHGHDDAYFNEYFFGYNPYE